MKITLGFRCEVEYAVVPMISLPNHSNFVGFQPAVPMISLPNQSNFEGFKPAVPMISLPNQSKFEGFQPAESITQTIEN